MPSDIERAIATQRRAVLAQEQRAIQAILNAYQPARADLILRIDAFAKALADRDLTASEAIRFERSQQLFTQIEEEVARLAGLTHRVTVDAQTQLVAMAASHALALVERSAGATTASLGTSWNRVNTGAVEALVGRMSDGSPLHDTLMQFGTEARPLLVEGLTRGVSLGTNPRAIAAELAKVIDADAWKLLRIARTEALNSYRTASLASYQANADILDGWIWTSAHQRRTCLACLSLDGRHFPLSVEFMPSHVSCRCAARPSVKGAAPANVQTGQEWFDAQPEAVRREMVPVSAWDELNDGRLRLDDFAHLEHNERWGDSYRQANLTEARAAAAKRLTVARSVARDLSSVDDFSAAMKGLGVDRVELGKADVAVARNAHDAIAAAAADGLPVPKTVRLMQPSDRFAGGKSKPVAAYSADEDALVLNPSKRIWSDADQHAAEQFKAGWWSSDDGLHAVNHELGHQAHFKSVGLDAFEAANRLTVTPLGPDGEPLPWNAVSREIHAWKMSTGQEVSRYAMTNRGEFAAEVYAGIRSGKTYSDGVMAVYRAYGGPDVTPRLARRRSA